LTGLAFFAIGVIRGRIVDRQPLAAGIETLLIGGAAAVLAFAVGRLLQGLAV
jgi:VIT1/CCC1 family predicted Fe2+/Mn2+ transporter